MAPELQLSSTVMRSLVARCVVAGVLIFGLTGTSATLMAAAATCMEAHHDCSKAVLTDCCCQPQPAGTAALSAFVVSWTSVTKLLWNSTTWTADVASATQVIDTAFALMSASGRASPPAVPNSPTVSLTALLI